MQQLNRTLIVICLLIGLCGIAACTSSSYCNLEKSNGHIESVRFPDSVSILEEIPIYVQVQYPGGLCLESTTAMITAAGLDTFLITANLNAYDPDEACPCLEPQTLSAVVIFKSSRPGDFVFIYNKDDETTTSSSDFFQINVK